MTCYEVTVQRDPPAGYDSIVGASGSFYHHPAWIEGLARCFRFDSVFVTAARGGVLVGALPLALVPPLLAGRRLVSLPFSYAAGPVGRDANTRAVLYDAARSYAVERGIRRLEIKSIGDSLPTPDGFVRTTRYSTYRVSTKAGIDDVWQRLHAGSTRRGIKKSQREGVIVERSAGAEGWALMAQLQHVTSHRLGLPAPPTRFFTDVAHGLEQLGLAQLYLARLPSGQLAAAIVCWKSPREWIYGFGASLRQHSDARPTHALLWAAINDATTAGADFDLGRAAPEQAGLVEFKRRWGGEPIPLSYDHWPSAAGLNTRPRDRGGLAVLNRMWSALPAAVARRGSFLYRYLG
jgi:hypothetical protein